jgi:hypothetical protein
MNQKSGVQYEKVNSNCSGVFAIRNSWIGRFRQAHIETGSKSGWSEISEEIGTRE